ncbi:VQ motif-containing protein 25-like [Andrographis paniculata]|uniref:VQ motif-containing protein 25-like n=1 Tax=Andrographis paniculata TaxID=175694 RepID=UPI0021E89612|nr:VQ motif-containing protein 25-like [Andrographis paniculata]
MKARSGDTAIAPSKLVIHNSSHTIVKQKPKIRIIHIIAPEIIKTDVQNFRELVQQLTGRQGSTKKKEKNVSSLGQHQKTCRNNTSKQLQSTFMPRQRMKQEIDEIQGMGISNPFISFLGDVNGFIHDINEFPILPMRSSQVTTLDERHLY